ncbi:MAG: efflux RND transporter periplasmic adaptor subunit [Tepidisphaeraceae bacterium]
MSTTASRKEIDDAETLVQTRAAQVESARQQLDMLKTGTRPEQVDSQRAVVRQLEGVLTLAQIDLKNTVIVAPNDATVLSRNVEVGEFVTNGFVGERGAKGYVVSIADLNDLRVDLDIPQTKFSNITPAQRCWITTDTYPDRRYEGVVDLISPEANRQKASVQVRVKVLKPDGLLRPDMDAKVSFIAAASTTGTTTVEKPLPRVPGASVSNGSVWVVENDRAVRRRVTVGRNLAGGDIEIRDGLMGGEDLVVDPPATLKDGDRVTVWKK